MALIEINEKNSAFFTLSFYDKDEALETPSNIYYTVYDEISGTELKAETEITPADSSVELTLTGEAVEMHDETLTIETHVLWIRATYGTEEQNQEYRFRVRNLVKVIST